MKLLQLMVRSKVERIGLNTAPCRNTAWSGLFWCAVMALCALCIWVVGSVTGRVLGGIIGMFHRPLVLLLWTLMMILLFFKC